ncbi:calcium-translocating P-type ATPase, PMCA-type protein (macronuclear) [Tetrahymena thermophila SB210]|uniref:Calcium-transporting ATPase n=1 Tax=Tetrahymena thermophila (strain SB210) TaxID=312017 RepID=I7ME85_TETTS|nr:calcium-translocating P-type ATPase, PMCA-type protein [Tetrahymena thermophila SB210]EAR95699.2 calcium-translocating P-type ATPase, PMCA-type protein [Tetrahymena thermophila SB210]|eukprot:XP_001015944.2 calcium-translocating P-type ATPase, PMCA-type protein [Tetrahymena thermophila SB210]
MSTLKEPLRGKHDIEDQSSSGEFGVDKQTLSDLFQPDNIRDGHSLQKVEELGGVDGISRKLKTSPKQGIETTKTALKSRIQAFGENENIVKPPKSFWELVVGCFEEEILRILCAAALVSLIIGCIKEGIAEGWIDGMAIFVAVFLIVSITSTNDYMKDKQFRKLNEQAVQRDVGVIRNGEVVHVSIFSLLVGDIMHIETGDILPVDGFLIKGNNLVSDESSITGETDPIKKYAIGEPGKSARPFLIAGSKIVEGSGEMIVMAVGQCSSVGKQHALMNEEEEEDKKTPLQVKLNVLVDQIGKIGLYCAGLTFLAMLVNLIISVIYSEDPEASLFTLDNLSQVVDFFIISVAIIVMAIPEGLPLAVTISLAFAVGKMKDENNLVRTLESCETMGGADTICSDKTGTLTENRMKVKKLFALEEVQSEFDNKSYSSNFTQILTEGLCVNSNAFPTVDKNGNFSQNGNKTECALLELAYQFDVDYRNYRPSDNIIKVIPFSSDRKRMTTVYQPKEGNKNILRVYTKGAPDIILDFCKKFINRNGQVETINEDFLIKIKEIQKKFANDCLRTLLLTYKEIPLVKVDQIPEDKQLESDLIILGMVGIQDPLRKGIRQAVQTCKEAGVTVRMVTGDNLDTAIAISKEAGIIDQDFNPKDNVYTVMEGKRFREKVGGLREVRGEDGKIIRYDIGNLDVFREIKPHLRVLARSTPDDKFLLVTGLQKCGSVVAVTGDGTNDAPALKKADIGFAMGIAGTEVAKEAAGIILIDDNFSSTITAIKWGRNIFDCIRKFLQFQLTINVVALFMAFMGGVVIRESPLNTVQMLWVNLIMDTFAALALATEPPNNELLKRKPVKRHEVIITPTMWNNIIVQGIYQILVLTVVLFYGNEIFGVSYGLGHEKWDYENGVHLTLFFQIFVFFQVFNEINARKLKATEINPFAGFFNNPMFLVILVTTVVVQMALVEYGGRAVRCSPLTTEQNIHCLLISASSLVVGFLAKFTPPSLEALFNRLNPFREGAPSEVETVGSLKDVFVRPSLLKQRSSVRNSFTQRISVRGSQRKPPSENKPIEMQRYN